MQAMPVESRIYERPAELLQRLIRFDTTNPPGNEAGIIGYLNQLLSEAGIPTQVFAKDPDRPNLLARMPGLGSAPPLLVYAHVDVVSTANQAWQNPPFEAREVDGIIWGRGALDDKGGAAMSLAACLRAAAEGLKPAGDVLFLFLCDEEAGGELGAKYLVQEHPDLFTGIRHAIGEVGGFTFHLAGKAFYPIMVSEKRMCMFRATVRGPAHHAASMVVHGGAAAKLGHLLTRLDQAHSPVYLTSTVRRMIETMSASLPFPAKLVLRQLANPALADRVLALLGSSGQAFYALLHNTWNVTTIHGGEQSAGTPAEVCADLFAMLLPGFSPEDLKAELQKIAGDEVEFQITQAGDPIPAEADLNLYGLLAEILREADPQGIPMPLLMTTPTDARTFNRLGIQTYGFQPMKLPPEIEIAALAHGADERIPVEAMEFGTEALYTLLHRYGSM
jgi:acetylornithine deacetylase/succinyl-diaminopimelate desuccinylase-like protein